MLSAIISTSCGCDGLLLQAGLHLGELQMPSSHLKKSSEEKHEFINT